MADVGMIVPGLPGMRDTVTATPYMVFRQRSEKFIALNRIIDGTKSRDSGNTGDTDRLRPGLLMGKVTSGGKYANSILGVVQSAYTSGGTTLTVTAAQATEIARRVGSSGTGTLLCIGPPSAAGTVASTAVTFSAVNTSTGEITVTSLGVNKIAGSWLVSNDGSGIPKLFLPDGYPMPVTVDGSSQDQPFPLMPVAGIIDVSKIIDYPTDTSMITWLKTQLDVTVFGQFSFSDDY